MTAWLNVSWRALLICLVALYVVGCSSTDSEEEQGPAPLVEFKAERIFKKAWSRSIGDGQGDIFNRLTPGVEGRKVYVASADGEVMALQLSDGKKLWASELEGLLVGGVGVGEHAVFVGSTAGEVIALDKSGGNELWRVSLGGEVLAAPESANGLVFVQTFDGQLVALKAESGARVWDFRSTVPVLTLRGTSRPLIYRNTVLAAFANGRIVSFDLETGVVRWNTRVSVAKGDSEIQRIIDIDGNLLEENGIIYAVSYQGKIAAIDANSGRTMWANDASSYASMSKGFGNIYVTGQDGSVTAFEKTGRGARWAQTVLARRKLTGSATLSSYVIVGDAEGYIHALSQVNGNLAARARVDSDGIQVDLQAVGDLLLVYGNSGKLVAYRLEEVSRSWF